MLLCQIFCSGTASSVDGSWLEDRNGVVNRLKKHMCGRVVTATTQRCESVYDAQMLTSVDTTSGLVAFIVLKISAVTLESAEIFGFDAAGTHWQLLFPASAFVERSVSGNFLRAFQAHTG